MTIEVKSNIDFSAAKREIIRETEIKLGRALEEMAREIVTRTRTARGPNGEQFKALSPKYRRYKEKKGRKGVPDLTFTGKMLASITTATQQIGNEIIGRIYFNSVKEAQKARGNQRTRRFFTLSRQQVEKLVNLLRGQ